MKGLDKLTIELGDSPNNIKVINNFIDNEDIDLLVKYGRLFSYFKKNNSWPEGVLIPSSLADIVKKYEDKMISTAQTYYGRLFEKDRYMDFSYRHEGTFVEEHSDNVSSEINVGRELDTSRLRWSGHLSIIAYLNDTFEGGEIYFPKQNFLYSPKVGDLIMFPGTYFYPHEVKKFQGDTRITMSLWTRFADFTGEEYNA